MVNWTGIQQQWRWREENGWGIFWRGTIEKPSSITLAWMWMGRERGKCQGCLPEFQWEWVVEPLMEIENIRRGVILGRKCCEFNMVLFCFFHLRNQKRHRWSSWVGRPMSLGHWRVSWSRDTILTKVASGWSLKPWEFMQYLFKKAKMELIKGIWSKPWRTPNI